jgi:outer membrane protein OmpA-like peptidoglycan-associated protein
MESASVNAELPDAFPPAPPLAGEGAPALLVAVLAAVGATLAAVSASIWLAPPVTPPEPVTIVVHEQSPPPPPIIIREPAPPPIVIHEPAPEWTPAVAPAPPAPPPPPCFDPLTVMFARDSAAPLAGTDAGIARLRDWLGQHADAKLLVEGHADNRGSEAHNLVLSFARAKSVASILAGKGVPASRMTVRAAGSVEAAAAMDARDRRVVVGIEGLAACKSATGATEHP